MVDNLVSKVDSDWKEVQSFLPRAVVSEHVMCIHLACSEFEIITHNQIKCIVKLKPTITSCMEVYINK